MSLQPKQFQQLTLPGTDVPTSEPSPGPHGPAMRSEGPGPAPYQTRMLWPTSEVIDNVHKIDSNLFQDGTAEPREQWDDIRDEKSSHSVRRGIANRDPIPPIRIMHPYKRDISHDPERRSYEYEPELWDGHHRLFEFERAGHTEVPVYEAFDRHDGGPSGGGFTGLPYWRHR